MNMIQLHSLEKVLNLNNDFTIQNFQVARLSTEIDSGSSLIIAVDVILDSLNGPEVWSMVAKMIPQNEYLQEIFQTEIAFRNELAFYSYIYPTMEMFQRQQGMTHVADFVPYYYGGRANLHDNPMYKVDADAIILVENLGANYRNPDRLIGLDFRLAKEVMYQLAQFHAIPLAIKLQNPSIFVENIKRHLHTVCFNNGHLAKLNKVLVDNLQKLPGVHALIPRVLTALEHAERSEPKEPFATINHNNLWTNNIMSSVNSCRIKFLDFQTCGYGSPAKDILFFLYTSVKSEVIAESFESLLQVYFDAFVSTLRFLKCGTTMFSFGAFLDELAYEAKNSQFVHIVMMLLPILTQKKRLRNIEEFKADDYEDDLNNTSKEYLEKLEFVVQDFAKRDWI